MTEGDIKDQPPQTSDGPGPGGKPVDTSWIIILSVYLLAMAVLIFIGLYRNWPSCEVALSGPASPCASPSPVPSPTANTTGNTDTNSNANNNGNANSNANAGGNANRNQNANDNTGTHDNVNANSNSARNSNSTPPKKETPPATTPSPERADVSVTSVSPKSGLICGGTEVTIRGSGFKKGATVTFDGLKVGNTSVADKGGSLSASTPGHAEGDVDVTVINDNGSSDTVKSGFTYMCPPIPGSQLLLIVILAGALGGTLHALRSLYWYVGNRWLVWSWAPMYFLLPFIGATMAVIFYVIVRGGFLNTQPGKDTSLVIIAIASLVGLFSQQAALKLNDIANAVFTKPGQGADNKPQASLPPAAGNAGAGTGTIKPTAKLDKTSGTVNGGETVKNHPDQL